MELVASSSANALRQTARLDDKHRSEEKEGRSAAHILSLCPLHSVLRYTGRTECTELPPPASQVTVLQKTFSRGPQRPKWRSETVEDNNQGNMCAAST